MGRNRLVFLTHDSFLHGNLNSPFSIQLTYALHGEIKKSMSNSHQDTCMDSIREATSDFSVKSSSPSSSSNSTRFSTTCEIETTLLNQA